MPFLFPPQTQDQTAPNYAPYFQHAISLVRDSDHKAEALEYMKVFISKEAQELRYEFSGAVARTDLDFDALEDNPRRKFFLDTPMATTPYWPPHPWASIYRSVLQTSLDKVLCRSEPRYRAGVQCRGRRNHERVGGRRVHQVGERAANGRTTAMKIALENRRMRSLLQRSSYLLYVVPALAVFLLFRHYAIIEGLRMSLIDFNPRGPSEVRRAWSTNVRVLQRPRLFESFLRTIYFLVLYLPPSIAASLLIALLINARGIRGTLFFKVSFFIPVISTFAAMSYVWESIINPDFGPVGALFAALGMEKFFLLGSTHLGDADHRGDLGVEEHGLLRDRVLGQPGDDRSRPFHEAARCDGANAWQQFRYVTAPFLHAAFTVSILIGLVERVPGIHADLHHYRRKERGRARRRSCTTCSTWPTCCPSGSGRRPAR